MLTIGEATKDQQDKYPYHRFYVVSEETPTEYLHSDGLLHFSTYNRHLDTGWFSTKKKVEAAIELYLEITGGDH